MCLTLNAILVDFCNFRHITYTVLFCFICQFIFVGGKMPLSQQLHYVYCRSRTSRRIPYAKGQHSKICCLPACLPACLPVCLFSVFLFVVIVLVVSLSLYLFVFFVTLRVLIVAVSMPVYVDIQFLSVRLTVDL